MTEQRPTLLIAECARGEVRRVTVEEDHSASPPPSPLPSLWYADWEWSVAAKPSAPASPGLPYGPDTPAPARIVFFDAPPPGWRIEAESLWAFREDRKYRVHAARVFGLEFTVAQLRALRPGDVLTSTAHRNQLVVSESEFQKTAAKHCGK